MKIFHVGMKVRKPKGYAFDGIVRAIFETGAGEWRYVVESSLTPGLLHIFNADQLELRDENPV